MSSRRKRLLDEAAEARKRDMLTETEDVSRVYDRFFTSSQPRQAEITSLENSASLEEVTRPAKIARPEKSSRSAKNARLAVHEGAKNSSLAESGDLALQSARLEHFASHAISASQPQESGDVNLMASLPDVAGFTKFFHQITDHLYPQLSASEQSVHLQLYRLTWGRGEPFIRISLPRLAVRCNMSERTTHDALAKLITKGLVRKGAATIGKGREQGIEYWVTPAPRLAKSTSLAEIASLENSSSLANSASNKEINTHKDNSQTHVSVSVNSRFSLEECRRYAEHLKQTGQGITNPGGYATKIFRSGEADAFIEGFLSPPAQVDVSLCPDCRGTGFIYIDQTNHDRGVRPCRHDGLRTGAQ
jgi:hypothetical protein